MFAGPHGQRLGLATVDLRPQGSGKGAPFHCFRNAVGLRQLRASQPAQPGATAWSCPVNDEPATRTYHYAHQCTDGAFGPASDAGPERGRRLTRSFLGRGRSRPLDLDIHLGTGLHRASRSVVGAARTGTDLVRR